MEPEASYLGGLIESLKSRPSIYQGKQLHVRLLKKGLISSALSLANRLLLCYSGFGTMEEAQNLFDEMSHRNCFSWNVMIEGYLRAGEREKSLGMFETIPERNDYAWNVVVSGLAKAGEMGLARRVFDDMPSRNVVVWNSMIHGYVRSGSPREAIGVFRELISDPVERHCCDPFVLASVVGACADLGAIRYGKQIHGKILIGGMVVDMVLCSSLVNLYGKCGDLYSAGCVLSIMQVPDDFSVSALITCYADCGRMTDASRAFKLKENPSVVVWNSLIAGYVTNNEVRDAVVVFNEMCRSGTRCCFSTIVSVLSGCSSSRNYLLCNQVHAYACKAGFVHDLSVACTFIDAYSKCGRHADSCKLFGELKTYDTILLNSMITVYSKCGRIEDAKHIFEAMPSRSVISWNSMIVGLSQNGCPLEALDLFCRMNKLQLRMDSVSLASVISACASISSLELGEQVFGRSIVTGLVSDQAVSTSLVDWYCKCGSLTSGRKLFDSMMKSDVISWNCMLVGYANNGHGLAALKMFDDMIHAGLRPTAVTFTAVLSACNHCGLIDEGRRWFSLMKQHYNIDPGIKHYSCMVDLLSRAGCLQEAVYLIENMPFETEGGMWCSVLRGCVSHGDKDLGKSVATRIIELDPENAGAYVQLSGIFASSGEWESSTMVRKLMRQIHTKQNPGYSWAR